MIDFFDDVTLSDLGAAGTKAATRPKADPKAKFIQMGELNTEQLTHGESRTHWCHVQRDGSVIVTLKNGARLLNSKKPHFVCKDKEAAMKYIAAAMAAAEEGKFDEIFRLQTNRGL